MGCHRETGDSPNLNTDTIKAKNGTHQPNLSPFLTGCSGWINTTPWAA